MGHSMATHDHAFLKCMCAHTTRVAKVFFLAPHGRQRAKSGPKTMQRDVRRWLSCLCPLLHAVAVSAQCTDEASCMTALVKDPQCACTGNNTGIDTAQLGASYGKSCSAWDSAQSYCTAPSGKFKAMAWCQTKWCYVSANCHAAYTKYDLVPAAERNSSLYYSYARCDKDTVMGELRFHGQLKIKCNNATVCLRKGESCNYQQLCKTTDEGSTARLDGRGSKMCNVGTYAPTKNSIRCMACAPGRFSRSSGQSHCDCAGIGYGASADGTKMDACGPGLYTNTSCEPRCKSCESGKFSSDQVNTKCTCAERGYTASANRTAMVKCAAGTFSSRKCSACEKCPSGKFQDELGMYECTCAHKGHVPFTNRTNQRPCAAGQYSNKTCASFCASCEAGKYQPDVGMSACDCVPRGYVSAKGGTDEAPCPPGTHGSNSTCGKACTPCETGKYQKEAGMGECVCAAAGYKPSADRRSQIPCAGGYYSNNSCASACARCDPGQYTVNKEANSGCKCTEIGYKTNLNRTTEIACAPGSHGTNHSCGTTCTPCESGKFQKEHGMPECICVDAGYIPSKGKTGREGCPKGTYNNETCQAQCTRCAHARYQPSTGATVCLCARPGYISFANTSRDVQQCGPGTYMDERCGIKCKTCARGQVSNVELENAQCKCTEAGYTSDVTKRIQTPCLPGTYSNHTCRCVACFRAVTLRI